MQTIPLGVELAALTSELDVIPLVRMQDGSGSSHFDGPEGWIWGLYMTRVQLGVEWPILSEAVRQLGNAVVGEEREPVQVMLNLLEAGGQLRAHRDGEPDHLRFHLPLVTHPEVEWWDEIEGTLWMREGQWYGPVPYCGILHSVANNSPLDRVHLIVDFERPWL